MDVIKPSQGKRLRLAEKMGRFEGMRMNSF